MPRVAQYPPYPLTAADDAIDLAATCGLILDEWQQYVLRHGMGHELDGSWTASRVSCWVPRQNGKGGIIEALELYWLFVSQDTLIVHSAHQHRTSKQAYDRLETLIRANPELKRLVSNFRQANGEQAIELVDGRQLQYHTRSQSALRGFSSPKIVMDEAQELNEAQMAAVMPTLSAMPNWQLWFFGTPPSAPDAWAYNLREDGEAGTERMAHFDWGAALNPTEEADRQKALDQELWFQCNPALGTRIQLNTVVDEAKPSGLGRLFAQERLGAWQPRATGGAGVIADALWRDLALTAEQKERPEQVAIALDINPARTHAAIVVAGARADGTVQLSVADYRAGTSWCVDRLVELRKRWDPVAIALDVKGPAGSLLLDLERAGITAPEDPEEPRRGDLAVPTAGDVAAGFGRFVDAAREKKLRHLDEAPINVALAGAKTRSLSGGSAWDRKGAVDICPLVAATLAHWAFVTLLDKVNAERDEIGVW